MFVSYAKTPQEFRDEIVKLLRNDAENEKQVEYFGKTRREAMLAKARRIVLERQALFLASIVFQERRELTRTEDEAQPEIDLRPQGFKEASRATREVTSSGAFPHPDEFWP